MSCVSVVVFLLPYHTTYYTSFFHLAFLLSPRICYSLFTSISLRNCRQMLVNLIHGQRAERQAGLADADLNLRGLVRPGPRRSARRRPCRSSCSRRATRLAHLPGARPAAARPAARRSRGAGCGTCGGVVLADRRDQGPGWEFINSSPPPFR